MPLTDGFASQCKKCHSEIYKGKNKYKDINKFKEYQKEYQSKNKDDIYKKRYKKIKEDKLLYLRHRISNLIRANFKSKDIVKKSKTTNILGCDYLFFKEYIFSQFKKGMNWDNIELDHIKPMHSAKNEKEIYDLNHYTNFQPLFKKQNREKSNKLITKQLKFL